MPIALPPAQLLELTGTDAAAFAHAQFCNDVVSLAPGRWQWNAWLSAQGRVRAMFALLRLSDERLVLLLRGGEALTLRAELARYVFRSRVTLQALSHAAQTGYRADEVALAPDTGFVLHDDSLRLRLPFGARVLQIGLRDATASEDPAFDPIAAAAWHLDDIRAGLAELVPALQDQLLPPWLGLDRLGAYSVSKGCYPGQEVIARLHFKGGNKRGLFHLTFAAETPPPSGTTLSGDAGEVGLIVDAAPAAAGRGEALAVLRADQSGPLLAPGLREVQVISRFG